ncbi:MAG: tRNA lysidine(34) synthetase TilS [Synechococcaceae cyanobacterium]|nr:tRNA lysidine(34) synthetase TilS [Synechococcaceae cyanobacterium]
MILPSGPRWSADHLRLHRHLRRHPALLPVGAPLLLAVSGGQDSMALLALLRDLQRLHHWSLQLWHGDHRWRPESATQAADLAGWCGAQGLTLHVEAWEQPADRPDAGGARSEAAARAWRYARLAAAAHTLGASHVVTGHTASDRAETLLLHLARGSHRRGLASLRGQRPLATESESGATVLARPLLPFTRVDTGRLCRQLDLPVWPDPCNNDRRYSRNRIRAEVLPVLEALHPGAASRISAQAERLVEEVECRSELVELGLQTLQRPAPAGAAAALGRRELTGLARANQRQLLHPWLERHTGGTLPARQLEGLLQRLERGQAPGCADLGAGWQLRWDRCTLWLNPPSTPSPR